MTTCIFCQIVAGQSPSWKIDEDEHAYAFLDINPVSKYHTLVIPKQHFVNIFDVSEEAIAGVAAMMRKVSKLYEEKLGIKNIQIISNSGKEAQQVVFHLHYHVVPRQFGDGLDIRWKTNPEWRKDFDGMIQLLE